MRALGTTLAAALCACAIALGQSIGHAAAEAIAGPVAEWGADEAFAVVSDWPHSSGVERDEAVRWDCLADFHAARTEAAVQAQTDAGVEEVQTEPEPVPEEGWSDLVDGGSWELGNFQGTMGDPDGLNSFDGTYDFNGHHETFYASYAVYDDQLWVDDDGFFRDDQGRYVVASSDYEEGAEIEISQGTAVVMDSGCESGTVDVHVTWGR